MITVEDVKKRLESLGIRAAPENEAALSFALKNALDTCKNDCNVSEVPDGLKGVVIDMAAGEFLLGLKTFTPNSITGIDLDSAIKQIQTGDTNTVFAVGNGSMTPEERLNAFINYLLTHGKGEFAHYRRLRW